LLVAHDTQDGRVAFRLTSDEHRAEEVVADAFARVWQRWRKGEIHEVHAYVRRAVVNAANSSLRRRYLERWQDRRVDGDERGIVLHDEAAAARSEMWQAILRLPVRQRQVIVLRFYEDLTVAETAQLLGVGEGTVKSQSAKAYARLGAVLESAT
jgi:RNA polymerase sigma-70 factor (sigma-E family)